MKKVMLCLIITLLCLAWIPRQTPQTELISDEDWVFDLGQFREHTYHNTLKTWEEIPPYEGSPMTFSVTDQDALNPHLSFDQDIVVVESDQTLSYTVDVPYDALYHITLDIILENVYQTSPTIALDINGSIPFNEMSAHPLDVTWDVLKREGDQKTNRFGNELLPLTEPVLGTHIETFSDPNARYANPFWFVLEAGTNIITVRPLNQRLQFGDISLLGETPVMTYEAYEDMIGTIPKATGSILIEGEDLDQKNDVEVKPGYYKGALMSPTAYKTTVLNILDGDSMARSGTSATYIFSVPEEGRYKINLKVLQNQMIGMSSARRIAIDGDVPFGELDTYLFPYGRKWTNHTLGNNDGDFWIALEAGTHTLTIETTSTHLTEITDRLYQLMDAINSLGLAVRQITGNSADALIDWNILKFLPDVKTDLEAYADALEDIYDEINDLTPSAKRASSVSTLLIAANQLRRLAKYPNRLPNKLAELNVGSGSAYQLIGVAINQMTIQPLSIDAIELFVDDDDLTRAHPNIFERLFFQIKAFIYSFFDQRYRTTADPDDDVLDVWIGQSSLYLDIMQNMIDDGFTKDTGTEVRLSLLPNTQRIILNNATNTNPDVVLSIDSWEPYAYALRGMLADLSTFEGFDQLVAPYHPNNFTPMIYEDGVYGIPETQGLYLLYYRKDILSFLGLEAPDTWDDVLGMLPILQSYQMNFFHPLGGEGAYKGFGLTAPFIYQMGGEIYAENGLQTTFNEEALVNAITFMTDIFNIYNLPQQVPNFFEHFRSGSLPVGIQTVDLYLQLKYAAPELSGQWGVLPIPGMFDDTLGEVARWAPSYGKASILFEKSNMKEEGFELITWWNKADTQIRLLENIKMVLGERYLYLPANLEALEASIWDETLKTEALRQAAWSRIPAVTPGSYIVERELTNIWNKIVIDKVNPRIAIDQSIPRINRELLRKFEEFNYVEGGVIIREYRIPRNDNITDWIP
ncbi:MAG: extracellular solute-binding protein [Acholeplasmataceae bacterium]|nr:extracellular solute-binding protein [Acholeplasmataceae bacterium]